MSRKIPYSAAQDDLYYPCKHATFFAGGEPKSNAGLCVEMARLAYCRQDAGFGFDRDRVRKVLGGVGFTSCQFFESEGQSEGRGTHCFLAIHEGKNLGVVSFRGTDKDDPTDLSDDMDVRFMPWGKGAEVHTGFADALAEVLPDLDPALQSVQCKVLFTGHSLGAALATLLASLRKPDALYTFGCPAVGNAAFVTSLAGVENHRYVDCCDLVTRVPPASLGYRQLGDPSYIDREGNVKFNPGDEAIGKDRLIAAAEYLIAYAWRIGDVAVRELADHAPVNYVYAVNNE